MYVFKRIDVKNNESILFFLLFAVATYHTVPTRHDRRVCAITGLTNATPLVGYFVYTAMVLLLCWLAWLVRVKYTLTIDEQTRRARQAPVCRRHRHRRRALSLCYAGRRRKTPLVRSFVCPVCPGRPSTRPFRHLRHRYKPTIGERQSLESINPTREPSTTTTTNFVLCIYIRAHHQQRQHYVTAPAHSATCCCCC